ncbi:MAG: tetratricopeptide repeat protein [Thermoplasmata archaeon]|nr:tetratricopeptide repeat protein [Thermoplasmata archaeon]
MIGREEEKARLRDFLEETSDSRGGAIIINGPPGIGKTTLTDWFCNESKSSGATVLRGGANQEHAAPFLVFSAALAGLTERPLFEEQEHISYSQLLAINPAGMLIAQASEKESELDPDIFAGMLTAVQNFVRDSFDSSGTGNAGLGRLEYGSMKIMIEHGNHLFLVAVLKDKEHTDMARDLRHALRDIEISSGTILENWKGQMNDVASVQETLEKLMERRYQVKKDLSGIRLEAERVKIAGRILDAVRNQSSGNHVVLVLEDLHWADESSLFALRFLARNITDSRIMILGTARDSEGPDWKKSLEIMREEGLISEIDMAGLDFHGVSNLIDSICSPNDFPAAFHERLHSDCAGNPFFVGELLRQMQHEGAISLSNGIQSLAHDEFRIPKSVEDVVVKRLEILESDSMAMAEYLSCAGKATELSIARSIQTLRNPSEAMGKLADAGIIHLNDKRAEFTHAIFQATIYSGISKRWCESYHRSIGEEYEKTYAGRLDEVYFELARHFSCAKPDAKAFEYCTKAGEKAEGSYAMEQAIGFYEKALAAKSKARLDPSMQQTAVELQERLGDIQLLTGSYDRGLENYMAVVKASESPETKARMYRKSSDAYLKRGDYDGCLGEVAKGEIFAGDTIEKWRLMHQSAYIMMRKGNFDRCIEMTEEVIARLQERPEYRKDVAQSQETLGSCYYLKGEFDLALEHYHRALELYEKIGVLRMLGTINNNIGNVYGNRAQLDLSLEHYNKTLAIMEKLGDRHGISVVLMNIAAVYQSKSELDKALEINLRSLKMGEMLGDQRIISALLGNMGGIYQMKGEPKKGLETLQKCLAIKKKIDDGQGIVWVTGNIGIILHSLGKVDEAMEILMDSSRNAEKIGAQWDLMGNYYAIGELYKDTDRMVQAEEYYRKAMALADKLETPDYRVECMRGLAEVLLTTGRLREALDLSAEAVEKANSANLRPALGTVLISRAMALAANGDMEAAETAFTESEEICSETGNPSGLARNHYERGKILFSANHKEKGLDCLNRALGEFAQMDMALWRDKCMAAIEKMRSE